MLRNGCGVKCPCKIIACHQEKLQRRLKKSKLVKKFLVKNFAWKKLSMALEGRNEPWL